MSRLFAPLRLRDLEFRNRIFVSPMCQYSSQNGVAGDWHMVHLGSRAVGGAALVIAEATAVTPEGRITPGDAGIWSEKHVDALRPITKFIRQQGSVAGIQIAHAGRKASCQVPWDGGKSLTQEQGAWTTLAPSAIPFAEGWHTPRAMSEAEILTAVDDFANATKRAHAAGFEVVEIHMAHGYLLHEFLSPLSNRRTDSYGGSLENRMRFPFEIARAVREAFPQGLPVFARISASDWTEGGWTIQDSVVLSQALKDIGIDLIDCSSGGNVARAKIPIGPGYQVEFAETIRRETGIATGAVGMITNPTQAEEILNSGKADAVLLARELLREPYWPLRAAKELGAEIKWPNQYDRAKT